MTDTTRRRPDASGRSASSDVLVGLLDDASRNHHDAFAELYDLTSRWVYGVVRRVLQSSELAADVTQEVYLQIWRQAGTFSLERGNAMSWMVTIAHRRAVDRVRSVVSQRRRDGDWCRVDTATPYDQVTESAEYHWEAERVRTALAALSDVQREAVLLAYFDGCTQREVADRLQVPLGTVKTRLRNALCILRTVLA